MFGLVALLAFPQIVIVSAHQPKENTVNQCTLVQQQEKNCEERSAVLFSLQQIPQNSPQSVVCCEILQQSYRLVNYFLPENRAGPVFASFVESTF